MEIYTDPVTGRYYMVDPATGETRWVDEPRPRAVSEDVTEPAPDVVTRRSRAAERSAERSERRPEAASARPGRGRAMAVAGAGVGTFVVLVVVASVLRGSHDAAARLSDAGTTTITSTVSAEGTATPTAKPTATPSPTPSRAPARATGAARVGVPARAGGLEFTVTGVRTTATLGNSFLSTQATGQFLVVSVTVKNVGRETELFLATSQRLFDRSGHQYAADGGAADYLGDGGQTTVAEVAPGGTAKGTVVFDVPAGITVDRIELHGSLAADGVDVKLP